MCFYFFYFTISQTNSPRNRIVQRGARGLHPISMLSFFHILLLCVFLFTLTNITISFCPLIHLKSSHFVFFYSFHSSNFHLILLLSLSLSVGLSLSLSLSLSFFSPLFLSISLFISLSHHFDFTKDFVLMFWLYVAPPVHVRAQLLNFCVWN